MVTVLALLFFLPLNGEEKSGEEAPEDKITIALSLIETENPWRTAQINSFKTATEPAGMNFIYTEPEEYTTEWQVQNVTGLLEAGIDYLVIAPHDTPALTPVLELAKKKGTHVFLIEQEAGALPGEYYTSLIGTDYIKEGRLCAEMLAEKFEGAQCNIAEITGTKTSTITRLRSQGFREEIQNYPNLKIMYCEAGNFDGITAQKAMEKIIVEAVSGSEEINAVFAHSDADGLGVLQALKIAGMQPGKDVQIVSVNGVQDVCKAIIAGEYLGTIESNPKWGEIAVMLVKQIERGAKPFPRVFSPYRIINGENAQEIYSYAY